MSNSIDTRIVEMKFDNAQFEAGVRQTLGSIDALNKGLKFDGAAKGLQGVNAAAKSVTLDHIAQGVDAIKSKFSAMSVVAITALSTITNKAISAGTNMVKALTVQPITSGLQEYETNLKSIQTILANTQAAGTNLKDVNGALKELNLYSDQTIYNFSEMAKNIGTFTAAGVELKTATASIKGIANLAALSGSTSEQASGAMYQLSQAISAGRVSLQDWNSVVNAGMGGTVFQRALAQTAERMGTLEKGSVKLTGAMKNATINGQSFRESITAKPGQESWLTSEVLTSTLKQFTGDMTDAQLKAEGFTDAQIKAIQAQAKMAQNAATQVKTATQLFDTLKESAGSGWAQTWETIIGDFDEAKKLWTGVNEVIGGFINRSSDARNKVLADWKQLGGRTAAIEAIKNTFNALIAVVTPIKDAFRSIFPATTGKQLADITKAIRDFTAGLKIGGETADRIKRTFAGVFAIFGIGWEIVKQVARVFAELFSTGTEGESSFLKITASIGDFLVALHQAVKEGEGLRKFFDGLIAVLKVPLKLIKALGSGLADMFSGLDFSGFDGLEGKFAPFSTFGNAIKTVWSKALDIIQNVISVFGPMASKFQAFFGDFGETVSNGVGDIDFGKVMDIINSGLFAGLLLLLKRFIGSADEAVEVVKSWRETFTAPFDAMTDTLGTMQNTLRAMTLLQIAAAVGILAASAVALSKVDADGLKRALGALTVMLVQIVGAMAVFQKISIGGGMTQLILLATALRILTSSVTALADMEWDELMRGLTGVTVLIVALTAAANLMPDGKKMISSSLGLIAMAAAIKLLASSVSDLAEMSWEEMARGLVGVGALLAGLTLFTKFAEANKGGMLQGAGLILLAAGIKILASAMTDLAKLSWEEIAKGLVAMAGGLTRMSAALILVPPTSVFSAAAIFAVAASLKLIAAAMGEMGNFSWEQIAKGIVAMAGALALIAAALILLPPTSLFSAAAIFMVATSLGLIASALGSMGSMSWEEIAKGLVTLAGALTIIGIAMAGMTTAIFGATALVVVAGALAILAPVLLAFGNMSWEEILKGLVGLAGALAVIGIAGALITPVIPSLLGLGIAVGLLGVGMLAAGAGVLAFSLGLTALAASAAAVATGIVTIVTAILGILPTVITALGAVIVALAQAITKAAPAVTTAITTVLMSILNSIIRLTPKIAQTLMVLLSTLLKLLQAAVPKLVQAGANIVVSILNGLAANIGRIVTAATNLIVAFLNGISRNMPRVLDAGVKLIISFVNGLATAIRSNQSAMNAAGRNLASAIVEGMASGISGGLSIVTSAAKRLAQSALNAAKGLLGIHSPSREFAKLGEYSAQGYAQGLNGSSAQIQAAANTMRDMLNKAMAAEKKNIDALEAKLKNLNKARRKDTKAINATKKALAEARAEYAKTLAASKVAASFSDETKKLQGWANQIDAIDKKLVDAKQKLADATKIRDDFNKSTADQFDKLPDISKDTKLTDYVASFQKQIADTQILTAQLTELRKLGLNDEMYRLLLSKGTEAIPFATQLLEGGKTSIDEINSLGSSLSKSADALGSSASSALYQAGVDAAAGLVKGLEQQKAQLEKQMDALADAMVAAIKKKLGIKSPSREFMKIGDWTTQGLAKGLEESKTVTKAAEKVGGNAIDAMRKTLSGMDRILPDHVKLNPHIRPVLDLTDVQKRAGDIGRLLRAKPLEVGAAYAHASNAALALKARRQADYEEMTAALKPGDTYNFTQNNNSPKALSNAEIYRNTKNQLSKAKGALTKTS